MTFAAPYPYNLAGRPPAKPTDHAPAPCVACQNKAGEIAYKNERLDTLNAELTAAREQITDLQAQVNDKPLTDREVAELRERMHLNARDAAAARRELSAQAVELGIVIDDRDSALRTAENLRIRMRAAGITP